MKVRIDSVEEKFSKAGKPYYIVEYNGKKASAWDDLFKSTAGKTVELEEESKVKGDKTYINVKFIALAEPVTPPAAAEQKTAAPAVVEKRTNALELRLDCVRLALETFKASGAKDVNSDSIVRAADKYFNYIVNAVTIEKDDTPS